MKSRYIKIISCTISGAISGAISVFSNFRPVSWRYDIGYDIIATYDIVYDIVPDQAKIHFLALQCDFLSRYLTGYRGFFTFYIGIYGDKI